MSACKDIQDKLLDWLYGDLPEAEAETLAVHLEGCEGCAKEAASFSETRSAFAQLPMEEPPAEMSTFLLHEASKQAQKVTAKSEGGLWQKFVDMFAPLAAHPGLAAAASLVLVVAVGGTIYVRSGGDMDAMMAQPEVAATEEIPARAPVVPADDEVAERPAAALPEAEPVADPSLARDLKAKDRADKGYAADIVAPETAQALEDARYGKEKPSAKKKQGRREPERKLAKSDVAPPNRLQSKNEALGWISGGSTPTPRRRAKRAAPSKPAPAPSGPGRAANMADAAVGGQAPQVDATRSLSEDKPAPKLALEQRDADDMEADGFADAPAEEAPSSRTRQEAKKEREKAYAPEMDAKSLMSALKRGNCESAVRTADRLRRQAPRTYAQFAKSKALASCQRKVIAARKRAREKAEAAEREATKKAAPANVQKKKSKK